MISRIETIDDLIEWLGSIVGLHTKNVTFEKWTNEQTAPLEAAQEVLLKMKPKFPNPFKQCIRCGGIWPATKEWFDWCGQGRDGLKPICKFCRNAYQKKRKAQKKSKFSAVDQAEIDRHCAQGDHLSFEQSPKPGERW